MQLNAPSGNVREIEAKLSIGRGEFIAMIAALMAMGLDTWDAARLGVYLHGAAGDAALHHGMGPHGLTASEVIFEARTLLNTELDDHHNDDTEEE